MEKQPVEVIAFLDQHRESHIKYCNAQEIRFDLERQHVISQGQRQQLDSTLSVDAANSLFYQFLCNDPAAKTLGAAAKVLKEAPKTTNTNKSFAKVIEDFLSLNATSSASQHSNGGRTPPQNVPPQNISPQNVPPQNVPPQNVPPQDVPYQNVPYQNVPDLNQSPLPVSVYIYVHSEAI